MGFTGDPQEWPVIQKGRRRNDEEEGVRIISMGKGESSLEAGETSQAKQEGSREKNRLETVEGGRKNRYGECRSHCGPTEAQSVRGQ